MNISFNKLTGDFKTKSTENKNPSQITQNEESSIFGTEESKSKSSEFQINLNDPKIQEKLAEILEAKKANEALDEFKSKVATNQDGYLKDAEEEIVSSKPPEKQQKSIDKIVNDTIDKFPGEVEDSKVYKDENGNILKEEMHTKDSNGETYTTIIEYDNQGRVSSVFSQPDKSGWGYKA